MATPTRTLRTALTCLALALASLPAVRAEAQEDPSTQAPPPPEQLPWAQPTRPAPPPPRQAQPFYQPDYVVPSQRRPPPPPPVQPPPPPPPAYDPYAAPAPPPPPYWGARQAWQPRVEVAFRGGFSTPSGWAAPGITMQETFEEQLSLGVELGVRTTPHLYVGLLAEGGVGESGPAYANGGCGSGLGCDDGAWSGRLGLQLRYHLAPYAPVDPWIGYGVAFSGAWASGSDQFGTYDRRFTGFEFAKLSAGLDLKLSRTAALGVYAEWTSGVFTELTDRADGLIVADGHLRDTSVHHWFTVGPRLRF